MGRVGWGAFSLFEGDEPVMKDYPENKMELIASQNVKKVLSVKTGEMLEVEIL